MQKKISTRNRRSKRKPLYAGKLNPGILPVGKEVLVENTAQKQCKGGKLHPAWLSPYKISKQLEREFMLKNPARTIIRKKVNISRLKVYTHREDCHGEESEKEGEIGIEGSGNENQRKGKGSERQLPDTDMDLKGKKRKLSTGDAVKNGKKRKVLSGNAEKVGTRVRCQLVI